MTPRARPCAPGDRTPRVESMTPRIPLIPSMRPRQRHGDNPHGQLWCYCARCFRLFLGVRGYSLVHLCSGPLLPTVRIELPNRWARVVTVEPSP